MKASSSAILDEVWQRLPALVECRDNIAAACDILIECAQSGGTVLVCGNGGSAADAEHIVGELMNRYRLPRPIDERLARELQYLAGTEATGIVASLQRSIRAISLVSQTALLTAISNDTNADMIFAQQVYGYGRDGDVLIAISTSGNARNVIYAVHVARALGLRIIGLTGKNGGKLRGLCTVAICVPADNAAAVQELHVPLYHAMCAIVENELFGQ